MGKINTGSSGGLRKYADLSSAPAWSGMPSFGAVGAYVNINYVTQPSPSIALPTTAPGDLVCVIASMPATGGSQIQISAALVGWSYFYYENNGTPRHGTFTASGQVINNVIFNAQPPIGPSILLYKRTVAGDPTSLPSGALYNTSNNYSWQMASFSFTGLGEPGGAVATPAVTLPGMTGGNEVGLSIPTVYPISPNRGLPYLHVLMTQTGGSGAVVNVGAGWTQVVAQGANNYSGWGAQRVFVRAIYGRDFNSSVSLNAGGSNFGAFGMALQGGVPPASPTFTVSGEVLLDRLELINSSSTDTRTFAVISGQNITSGTIGLQQSEVLGATYLKDEGVNVFQTDGTAGTFRVLAVGRPVS